jgi:putative transposase
LSLARQCQLLGLNRSTLYYRPKAIEATELELLRRLDELYLEMPVYGSRRMTAQLRREGYEVNRKRVQRLMQQLGLQAIYPKPKLTQVNLEHKVYPYLLRGVSITEVDQVWSTDITYLPVLKGHFYLVAMMDWFSRKVLSWRISNTMDVQFCLDALEEALESYGHPEVFNSDQGSQFTAQAFTSRVLTSGATVSMDGRGRCHDNIFIERLWRSLKYELIYLKAFEDGTHLNQEVKVWFDWYNQDRLHQSLNYATPDEVYFRDGLTR